MSHLVKKQCALRDLATLLEAARSLGWLVQEEQRVRYYQGEGELCDYTLSLIGEVSDQGMALAGEYNIGVQVGEDKRIVLLHDDAMNGREVMEEGKQDTCTTRILNKLKQTYQVCAARRVAQRKGWKLSEQVGKDGKVVLKMQVR